MAQGQISFGPFRLDPGQRLLSCDGVAVQLGSRAFDILCVLASANGEVVTKDHLMSKVWQGLVVEENNIQVHISALRKALDRAGNGQSYVITVPGRGYRLISAEAQSSERRPPEVQRTLVLPHKPSIAVLPFTNLSDDQGQDYFSDGITRDIITELSRFSELFVIASNSSFHYKDKTPNIGQVGRELGVHYALVGSIRRAGNRVRITGQLIDATTGAHLWAERYDRELEDVFAVQDEVVRTIVAILAAHVRKAEIERTRAKPPDSLQAYDYYLQAADTYAYFLSSFGVEDLYRTRRLLHQALVIDPNYGHACALLADTHVAAWIHPVDGDLLNAPALDLAHQFALKAVHLDPNLPMAHSNLGHVLLWKRQHDASIAEFERAVALNPNDVDWRFSVALVYAGQPKRAIEVAETYMRLDPFHKPLASGFLGFAHYMLKQYPQALLLLRESVSRAPKLRPSHAWLAATHAQMMQSDEARAAALEVLRLQPDYTIAGTARRLASFKQAKDEDHFLDGLRKAGLPE
jgi:adenylate cyclase